ncbi:hypothetical protein DSL72_002726 [Monilinia vaccinii-corymbosi]|uniref:Uncharacterized protein n=1 Tax=Monilinia vaccinii-corymbosi TaxID=61207 RepID=A0A8A3PDG9_9HELO|nr:hypothetical protein DSL72_002726 [Monilinia vaccinii-corymbosi]
MLSSQLASVSQTTTSPLILYGSMLASTKILQSAASVSNPSRHNQQTRAFRWGGCWSSYLDAGFEKEIQRRHRRLKYRCLEALDRKFAWDHHPSTFMKHFGKNFGCSAWMARDVGAGGQWVHMDRIVKTRDDAETVPRDAEHVERVPAYNRAMHNFLRSKTIYFSPARSKYTFKADVENTESGESIRLSQADESYWKNLSSKIELNRQTADEDYEIDPITNRKVFKKEKAVEIPVKKFTGYRRRFQNLVPPDANDATQADIENYNKPFMYNEPDGRLPKMPDSTEQGLKDYDKVSEGYKPFLFREPDGKLPEKPDSVQESLKEYDAQGYKPFFHNEPDGQPPQKADPIEEGLRGYDDCASYSAFRYREPDGKLPEKPDTVQESLKDYDATKTYGSFRHNEPDGKLPEKPDPVQESLKDYDATTSYGSFRYNEPDGKLPEKPDSVEESLKDYDANTSYGPFRYNEPDGKFPEKPDPIQESLKDYDTNTSYGSFRYNEPDGKFPERPDLVQESLKDYDANTSYGSFRYNEPDGKFPEKPDLARDALKEYDQKQARITQRYGSDSEVHTIKPSERDTTAEALQEYDSRTPYCPIRKSKSSQSPILSHGYPDTDTREDLDLLRASDVRAASGIIKNPKRESPEEKATKREQLEEAFKEAHQNVVEYAREIAAEQKSKGQAETKARELSGEGADALQKKDEKAYVREAQKRKVTGNFVRDFPEQFQRSWTQQKNGTATLTPKDAPKKLELSSTAEVDQAVQKAEKEYIDGLGSAASFSRKPNTPRLQTSLDRANTKSTSSQPDLTKAKAEVDPYSKVPQGLETSYKEECANQGKNQYLFHPMGSPGNNPIRSIYEDEYGKIDSKHRQVPANDAKTRDIPGEISVDGPEPTTYKVLAYDSATQSINIAETTSIVTDNASTLTPAEVLLRLSNPAKFFPHFQPLQAEGYEIISGGGDILVFRKVRPAKRSSTQADLKKNSRTNPIDGMQVATGRFASPTGFVNHDLPESAEAPFKSNIDVRREEPVFSGKSSWEDGTETKRKKPSKTKRIFLGGAIVGSGCYAIGVVTEYFRTGGIDGKGPHGF